MSGKSLSHPLCAKYPKGCFSWGILGGVEGTREVWYFEVRRTDGRGDSAFDIHPFENETERLSENDSRQESLVELRHVGKHYVDGDVTALDDLSLSVRRGEFVSIVGPSGCGKSTLLNMIGVLDRPTSGSVWFDGKRVDSTMNLDQLRAKKIGFVFQSFHLVPNLTASENVQLPMFGDDRSLDRRRDDARDLLVEVGLRERIDHRSTQLSNGQRQRVAVARALANRPILVLADEPTGALDCENGDLIMDLLVRLCREQGTTLVVVTHDRNVAQRADRVVHLRDGRIVPESSQVLG